MGLLVLLLLHKMADTSKGRHTLGRAVQDISHFLGYVLCLHGLGMLGSLIVRGTPWDPWTAPWHAFLRLAGEDKFLLYAFGTTVVTTIHFWTSALFYLYLDLTGKPGFLYKYKTQQEKNFPVPLAKVWKVAKHVLVNQIVLGIPSGIASYSLWAPGPPPSTHSPPSHHCRRQSLTCWSASYPMMPGFTTAIVFCTTDSSTNISTRSTTSGLLLSPLQLSILTPWSTCLLASCQ